MKSVRIALKFGKLSLQHPPTKLFKSECMSPTPHIPLALHFQPHPYTRWCLPSHPIHFQGLDLFTFYV